MSPLAVHPTARTAVSRKRGLTFSLGPNARTRVHEAGQHQLPSRNNPSPESFAGSLASLSLQHPPPLEGNAGRTEEKKLSVHGKHSPIVDNEIRPPCTPKRKPFSRCRAAYPARVQFLALIGRRIARVRSRKAITSFLRPIKVSLFG